MCLSQTEEARNAFAAARGFCHVHTWQLQQVSSGMGLAEGYITLLDETSAALRQLAARPAPERAARIEKLLARTESCAPCRLLRETGRGEGGRLGGHSWVAPQAESNICAR